MPRDLVGNLVVDLAPVSRWYVPQRLLLGIAAGAAISIVLVLAVLGPRPDMHDAMHTGMFWLKLAYPLSLAIVAGLAAERLARPSASARARIPWLMAPLLFVFALGAIEFMLAPPSAQMPLMMGGSARLCPFLVLAFSAPPLAGLIWAMRGLAPTRLGEAGAVIGLAAGGMGAFAYAWHCTESGAPFLAVWYTLGIAAAASIGSILGPRVLRWK